MTKNNPFENLKRRLSENNRNKPDNHHDNYHGIKSGKNAGKNLNQKAEDVSNYNTQNNPGNTFENTSEIESRNERNNKPIIETSNSSDDAALFREAIAGVHPLKNTNQIEPKPQSKKVIRVQRHLEEETFTYALSDFAGDINPSSADEFLEYRSNGVQQRLFKKLKNGQLSIESKLDMHGLIVNQAREIVSEFISICLAEQLRCVIIIHGKGSRGGQPVLKSMLSHWLQQIPEVLAYCSAQPKQGGTGALIILLKNNQKINNL